MRRVYRRLIDMAGALRQNDGFSLMELMIAITIMSILSIFAFQSYQGITQKAKTAKTKQILSTLSTTLDRYNLDNGMYPSTEQGLQALLEEPTTEPLPDNYNPGGYIRGGKVPKDGWGNDIYYANPGADGNDYDLKSYGADKKEGGEGYDADISVWDN
ncbi:MAG: type II secretion system major pseudopilin GspG [Spirochaetota bacterium]